MAGTTVLNLVYRPDRRLEIRYLVNSMRLPVAIVTPGLTAVNATTNCATHRGMALTTTLFIGEWLEVSGLVLGRDVRVTFDTCHIRVSSRCEGHILVAFATIDILCAGCGCGQNQHCPRRDMRAG
jgi:hypothetical protein